MYVRSVSPDFFLVFLSLGVIVRCFFFWFSGVNTDLVSMVFLCGRCTIKVTYCIVLRFVIVHVPI